MRQAQKSVQSNSKYMYSTRSNGLYTAQWSLGKLSLTNKNKKEVIIYLKFLKFPLAKSNILITPSSSQGNGALNIFHQYLHQGMGQALILICLSLSLSSLTAILWSQNLLTFKHQLSL